MEYFYKKKDSDKIWWVYDTEKKFPRFSFDKETVFYYYRDYPHKLTPEQKELFDRENPVWAR